MIANLKIHVELQCDILESTHKKRVLNISADASYQLFCQSVSQSINQSPKKNCAFSVHRQRLQEERELKRQQDLDYEESLHIDREV